MGKILDSSLYKASKWVSIGSAISLGVLGLVAPYMLPIVCSGMGLCAYKAGASYFKEQKSKQSENAGRGELETLIA